VITPLLKKRKALVIKANIPSHSRSKYLGRVYTALVSFINRKSIKTDMSYRQWQVPISFTSRNRVTAKKVDTEQILTQADFLRDLLMDIINTLTVLET
jgi:hypothetical protein